MVTEDGRLLNEFVENRSQEAFAQITERHRRLVYGTCLRELHDAALAEDAAQVVFCVLARKASGLRSPDALAAWLFTTARVTSRQIRKREQMRREREQQAFEQQEREQGESLAWAQIADGVNDAVAALSPSDREIVLLRFFDGLSLPEVGQALGIAEDTARMRVNRAVERLRQKFARDGFTASADALGTLLSMEAARPAPLASAAHLAQNALAPSAHTLQQTTEGVLRHMALQKLRLAGTIAGLGILGLAGGIDALHSLAATHKTRGAGAIRIAATASPTAPATVYTLRVDPKASSPGTPAISLTVSRQGSAERYDMTVPQSQGPQPETVLIPANSQKALALMPDRKGYTALSSALIPPDPFGVPITMFMPSASFDKMIYTYHVRDLGPEAVGGVRSEHYVVALQIHSSPQNSDTNLDIGLWLAPGKGAATAAERLAPVQTVTTSDGATGTLEIQGDTKALGEIAGQMPVKMTIGSGNKAIAFTLASHSTQPLATDVFQIPAGYQEIKETAAPPPAPAQKPAELRPQ